MLETSRGYQTYESNDTFTFSPYNQTISAIDADMSAVEAAVESADTTGKSAKTIAEAAQSTANAAMPKTGGTFTGNTISNNPAVGTQAIRNIYAGTGDPPANLPTGVIYFKYE